MDNFEFRISFPTDLAGAQAAQAAQAVLIQQAQSLAVTANQAAGGQQAVAQAATALAQAAGQAATETGRFTDAAGRLREANGRFVTLAQQAKEAGENIKEAGHSAEGLASKIETGIGFGIGGKIFDRLAELPQKFAEMGEKILHKGIEYDAEMQTRVIGLATSLRALEPEKYINFDVAAHASAEMLDVLRDKANALGLDFTQLGETFGVAFPTLVESGITKTSQQFDVLIRLSQLAQKNNLTGAQGMKEILDELLGRSERTILGKEIEPLGLTPQALANAKEAGTLAQLLLDKTSSLTEASSALSSSYTGSLRTIRNELDQLAGTLSKPVFERLNTLFQGVKGPIGDTQSIGAARGVGNLISDTLSKLESGAQSFEAFVKAHPNFSRSLGLSVLEAIPGGVGGILSPAVQAGAPIAGGYIEQGQKDAAREAEEKKKRAEAEKNAPPDTEAADRRKKASDEAQAKYEAMPRAQVAEASQEAAAAAEAAAAHEKRVEITAKQLQADKALGGMSREQALANAEREVSAQEKLKAATEKAREDKRAAAEKEREDAKAERDQDEAIKNAKQRTDALHDAQAATAILQAEAKGDKSGVEALEKKRDILRGIRALQSAGVSYAEAEAVATAQVNAQYAARDEKEQERDARRAQRHDREPEHRRGERETFTIHGYRDGDGPGGGLHTGGLTTGGLGGGGVSSAAATLAGAPSAASLLAGAPGYVPSFPTAAASLAPAISSSQSSGLSLGTGQGAANDPIGLAAAKFGDSAKGGLDKAAASLDTLSQTLLGGFGAFGQRLTKLEIDVQNALSQNANKA